MTVNERDSNSDQMQQINTPEKDDKNRRHKKFRKVNSKKGKRRRSLTSTFSSSSFIRLAQLATRSAGVKTKKA